MSKKKGSKAERELYHLLWELGWASIRVAGSGCTTRPSPDLISSNGKRVLAIECKAVKGHRKYLHEDQMEELKFFSKGFGAEPWIGVRFNNLGWSFIHLKDLPKSKGKMYYVTREIMKKNGLTLEKLINRSSINLKNEL